MKGDSYMNAISRQEVEKLKTEWLLDPIWDIYETEGFEEHRDELQQFQVEWEEKWRKQYEQGELEIDSKAKSLGVGGLYRIVLKQQEEIDNLKERLGGIGL